MEDDTHTDFARILGYPISATGPTSFTLNMGDATHSLSKVSLDSAGNIYVLSSNPKNNEQAILEYSSAWPLTTPVRVLPVGPGTKIPSVSGLTVSPAGEIFVIDGTGLSVFSATATGSADPERHITSSLPLSSVSVDINDNAYVTVYGSDTAIVVYGPTANGNASPIRALGGNLTQLNGGYLGGIATDSTGDLYVACICANVF